MKNYRSRTADLETIKFALSKGYRPDWKNKTARKHFYFTYDGRGAPEIEVSWFDDSQPSVTVGDTTTNDQRALQRLKKFW